MPALQLVRWSFTIQRTGEDYSEPCPAPEVIRYLKHVGAERYVFQMERGEESDRFHFQGRMSLKKKSTKRSLLTSWRHTGFPEEYLTLRPESRSGRLASFDYCTKKETRVKGPWSDRPVYTMEDVACVGDTPHPWQAEVLSRIKGDPDDRSVDWIHDPTGNIGKSKLMKYIAVKKLGVKIPQGTATQIKESCIALGPQRLYLVDLPRTTGKEERLTDLCSALEEIKNGWVQCAMHGKFKQLLMTPPHVWVVSNQPPPRKLMSGDRWRVWKVDPDLMELERSFTAPDVVMTEHDHDAAPPLVGSGSGWGDDSAYRELHPDE